MEVVEEHWESFWLSSLESTAMTEILRMASDASGIGKALFGQADERLKRSPLFGILKKNPYKGGVIPPENSDFVSDDNLFNYQARSSKRRWQRRIPA